MLQKDAGHIVSDSIVKYMELARTGMLQFTLPSDSENNVELLISREHFHYETSPKFSIKSLYFLHFVEVCNEQVSGTYLHP